MATSLRDLGLEPVQPGQSRTLEDVGLRPRVGDTIAAQQFMDQASANSMGQLRRGFTSGLYGADANALAAGESSLRAAGRVDEADALQLQREHARRRAGTFAPAEQDVTEQSWREPGRLLDYAAGAVGQGAASMMEPMAATTGLGAASGVLGLIPHPVARAASLGLRMAAPATAFGLNYRQNKGEFVTDAYDNPANLKKTDQEIENMATGHGIGAGLLDTAFPALVGERVAGRTLKGVMSKASMPAKIGADLAGQATTEGLQGGLKRGLLTQLDPNRDTSRDSADLMNDLVGGALGAGPFSAASRLAERGYARLAEPGDGEVGDDLSGKGKSSGAPRKGETITQAVARESAAKQAAAPISEERMNALTGRVPPGVDEDIDITLARQTKTLTAELTERATSGNAEAAAHLKAVQDAVAADPYEETARQAAAKFLIGDGQDHAAFSKKFGKGKKNEQTGPVDAEDRLHNQRTDLIAGYLREQLPEKTTADVKRGLKEIASELAAFAGAPHTKPSFASKARSIDLAEGLVQALGGPKAKQVVAKLAVVSDVASTALFKQLQQHIAAVDDVAAFKQQNVKARDEAALQLVAALPPTRVEALRKAGIDLSNEHTRAVVLDKAQDFFANESTRTTEKFIEFLGKDSIEPLRKIVSQKIAPRVREERAVDKLVDKDVGKSDDAGPADSDTDARSNEAIADDEETDAYTAEQAIKNVNAAPGDKHYFFKPAGPNFRMASSADKGHPFVMSKKGKTLPGLMKQEEAEKTTGTLLLQKVQAHAYERLGGKHEVDPVETAPPNKGLAFAGGARIRSVAALEVMKSTGVNAHKRVALLFDYLGVDKNQGLLTRIRKLDEQIGLLGRASPEEQAELKSQRRELLATIAEPAGLPETTNETTVQDVADSFFKNRFLVIAEQMAEKDHLRMSRGEFEAMAKKGARYLKFSTKNGMEGAAAVQADMNLIRFKSEHSTTEGGISVIPAAALVAWVRENRPEFREERLDARQVALTFRGDLMEGIGALLADNWAAEMPFMVAADGTRQSFERGFPPSLKLDTMTQGEMDKRIAIKAKKAAKVKSVARLHRLNQEVTARQVEREQEDEPDGSGPPDPNPEFRAAKDRQRVINAQDEEVETFMHQGAERGARDRLSNDKPSGERFWDAPELTQTGTDREDVVPTEAIAKQTSGAPTDFTDLRNRNAQQNTKLDALSVLTPENAARKAEGIADAIWALFASNSPLRSPAEGIERMDRLVRSMHRPQFVPEGSTDLAGGPQYAMPLAYLLTPARITELVARAKDKTKAKQRLESMYRAVAEVAAKDTFPAMSRNVVARLLLNDKTLGGARAAIALRKTAGVPPARKLNSMSGVYANNASGESAASQEALNRSTQERARGQARVRIDKYGNVDPILLGVDSKANAGEVIAQRGVGKNEWTVLSTGADVGKAAQARALALASKFDLSRAKYNEQNTPVGVQAAATAAPPQADIDKAIAYVKKVLGPLIRVEFDKAFQDPGEWIEAENLIKLSLTNGPGLLTVAHHEAMHAFWSRFAAKNPEMAKAMQGVLAGPEIYERLKDLLADHPNALKAIATDPEERIAYAYQFWAAGMLDVDKPATTYFAKFRRFLRMVFGMVRDSEVAADILAAFHEGDLANESAAGAVIDKIMKRKTWNADTLLKFDKQLQWLKAGVGTSNQVLRTSPSETLRKLGVQMFTNPGEGKVGGAERGYLNARRQVGNQFTNVLYNGVEGKDGVWRGGLINATKRDMDEALLHLHNQTDLTKINSRPARELVEGMRTLVRRYYRYATRSKADGGPGMQLADLGPKYFPRVWDLASLVKNKPAFIAMLLKPAYANVMAEAVKSASQNRAVPYTAEQVAEMMLRELIERNGVDQKGLEAEVGLGQVLSPFFASEKERHFRWLDGDPDLHQFMEKDLVGTMSRYLHQGVRSAEFQRRFGYMGEDLRYLLLSKGDAWFDHAAGEWARRTVDGPILQELKTAAKKLDLVGKEADEWVARHFEDGHKAIQAHEGSLGSDISPEMRKLSSFAMAYQNLRLLPLSLFAAVGDIMGLYSQTGDAKATFEAFTGGLKAVWDRWKSEASDMPAAKKATVWEKIAEMTGAVDSHMFLEQIGAAHTSEFMTDIARKSNRWLFMANGLTAWDRAMRVAATKGAVLFIQHHAALPDKTHSARWLSNIGLKPRDIPLDAQGNLITSRHELAAQRTPADATDEERQDILRKATADMEKVHYAIVRWVEASVLTPNAAQRPTWASDPHWAVLFHLKQFTYSFQDTILRKAMDEAGHGNMNPVGALIATVPLMIASDVVKGLVTGGGSLPAYMKGWDLGDWLQHGFNRSGNGGVAQFGVDALSDPIGLGGPTVSQFRDWIWNPTDIGHNVHNAIPGLRMIKNLPDLGRVVE